MRDMQILPFRVIDWFDYLNDEVYGFEHFFRCFNEHTPINQTMVRGNQVPYITEQCQRTSKHAVV